MVIWIDAWSLAVINRSESVVSKGHNRRKAARTGGRALAGDVKVNEDTLEATSACCLGYVEEDGAGKVMHMGLRDD